MGARKVEIELETIAMTCPLVIAEPPDVVPFASAGPADSTWEICGHLFRVTLWTQDEWDKAPPETRPALFQKQGNRGIVTISPV